MLLADDEDFIVVAINATFFAINSPHVVPSDVVEVEIPPSSQVCFYLVPDIVMMITSHLPRPTTRQKQLPCDFTLFT